MNRTYRTARGFTLIELLVVITIIGLLAAILIPSIAAAMKSAKKTRAMSQIRDLDGAIKRYYAEYEKMPVPPGINGQPDRLLTPAELAAVVEILINNSLDPTLNPKQMAFLDLDPASYGVDTVVAMQAAIRGGATYKDPWGTDYGILMDLNFDEKISDLGWGEIRAKVAVYSGGDKTNLVTPPFKTW